MWVNEGSTGGSDQAHIPQKVLLVIAKCGAHLWLWDGWIRKGQCLSCCLPKKKKKKNTLDSATLVWSWKMMYNFNKFQSKSECGSCMRSVESASANKCTPSGGSHSMPRCGWWSATNPIRSSYGVSSMRFPLNGHIKKVYIWIWFLKSTRMALGMVFKPPNDQK